VAGKQTRGKNKRKGGEKGRWGGGGGGGKEGLGGGQWVRWLKVGGGGGGGGRGGEGGIGEWGEEDVLGLGGGVFDFGWVIFWIWGLCEVLLCCVWLGVGCVWAFG